MHFAKEIVEAIMNKVNKNTNLKIKIGNALNKKRIYETESVSITIFFLHI